MIDDGAVDWAEILREPTEEEVLSWPTISDLARKLNMSRWRVYLDVKRGLLAVKHKGKYRISPKVFTMRLYIQEH